MASKKKNSSGKKKKNRTKSNNKKVSEQNKNTIEISNKEISNEESESTKNVDSEKETQKEEIKKENIEHEVKEENKEKNEKENEVDLQKIKDYVDGNVNKSNLQQEIVKEEKNSKKKWHSIFFIFILIIIITLFSSIFALLNINNTNIVKGVTIKNIDVSGLSLEDARSKIEKALNIELMQDLNIKYEDKYETDLKSNQIEFTYNIDEAVNTAYKIGRSGNILKDNYALLYTTFFGSNIDINYEYNEEFLDSFISDIESKLLGVVLQPSYYIEENQLIINKGIDGIGINKKAFTKSILENIQKRNAEKIINNNEKEHIQVPIISKKADAINIEKIYEEIYTEPKDAYYELEPFNIYPEVNGVDLEISVEEAKKQIQAEEKDEYRFNLKITPPEKTIKSFGIEAFPQLVASFSTKYDARNINRSKNLEIAAGKINGIVLMPGEVFSFNKIVGKRTVDEGYRDAKIYQDGAVVDGLAGGICQISSTLYNAALLANLEIVERRNHSFTTSYVPAGRDATVVYGTTDFQFKNSRTYPIKIEASVSKGVATFKVHSVSLEENEYEVKIIPIITQSIPYTTEQIPDPTLLPGQQIVQQSGQPGYRVTTYKELIQNGTSISKEVISNDVYQPMRTIVKIGP